jgi:hypothetical protein
MRRKLWIAVAAALLAGLVIGGVSLASGGPANTGNPMVINLISRATAINKFIHTAPPGWSTGDQWAFTDRLFLASAPSDQIGTDDGRCVLIDPVAFRWDCSITAHITDGGPLNAGDLLDAGTLTFVQGGTATLAVVGGTGPYRTARGDVDVHLGPPGGPHQITVNLILNP